MRSSHFWLAALFALSLTGGGPGASAQEATPGAACTTANAIIQSGGPGASGNYLLICNGSTWVSVLDFSNTGGSRLQIGPDTGGCTAAKDGRIRYTSSATPPYEYCDGGTTTWRPFRQPRCTNDATGECYLESPRTNSDPDFTAANIKSGTTIMGVAGSYSGGGTIEAAAGYFIMSANSWTPSAIGGMNGADALCLNEVQTYNWRYKSDAGTLSAGRVRAFLCNQGFCNNFAPNAGYFFARAGSTTIGGLAFKTDSSGNAPNFNETWSIDNFIGSTADTVWTGRAAGSATVWGTTGVSNNCSGWYSSAANNAQSPGGPSGLTGYTNNTGTARWNNQTYSCNGSTYKLICIVHPQGFTPAANPCSASATTYSTAGSHTYTVPAGCTALRIEAYGAGGGAGGTTSTNSGGGGGGGGSGVLNGGTLILGAAGGGGGRTQSGGGGGGYAMAYHSVASGTNLSVVVGGGGLSTCAITGGNGGTGGGAGGTGGGEGVSGGQGTTRFAGGGGSGGRTTSGCSNQGGDSGAGTPNFGGGGGAGGSTIGCYGVGGGSIYGGGGGGGSCGTSNYGTVCNGSAGGGGSAYAQDTRTNAVSGSGGSGGAAANSGPGTGGTSCGVNGGDGRVVITPLP